MNNINDKGEFKKKTERKKKILRKRKEEGDLYPFDNSVFQETKEIMGNFNSARSITSIR